MRAVVQRVTHSSVSVEGQIVGEIQRGLLVLLGVAQGDSLADAEYLASKIAGLRIFEDGEGKMNLDVQDIGGAVLVVSQFTLLGDVRRGRRPSFTDAARPAIANELYKEFIGLLEGQGIGVQRGIFQADMKVSLTNDGPVTLLLDSQKLF